MVSQESEAFHEIVLAVFIRESAVLLMHRRSSRRWYPDCWDLVGGHVEADEKPEDALVRECREEVGVEVLSHRRVRFRIDGSAMKAELFFITEWQGDPVNASPDEHDAFGWFGITELERLRLAHPEYVDWLPRLLGAYG
jgi:8-oxo-dGTP diphosphatase